MNSLDSMVKKKENKLKICIVQFAGDSEKAICKMIIRLPNSAKNYTFKVEITKGQFALEKPLEDFVLKNHLHTKIVYMIEKAQLQLNNEYGIATYWVFH